MRNYHLADSVCEKPIHNKEKIAKGWKQAQLGLSGHPRREVSAAYIRRLGPSNAQHTKRRNPTPADEKLVCLYAAWLAGRRLAFKSIKLYLHIVTLIHKEVHMYIRGLDKTSCHRNTAMRAAGFVTFVGMFHRSNVMLPSIHQFTPAKHLCVKDFTSSPKGYIY